MDYMTLLMSFVPVKYVMLVTSIVGLCSAVAMALPPPKQPSSGFYPLVYGVFNWMAFNFGHAKNASAPGVMSAIPPAVKTIGLFLASGLMWTVLACSTTQLATADGQLFCSIVENGEAIVAPIVQGSATAAGGPIAGAVAVIVTGQTAAWVQQQCTAAAKAVGATAAIPVAPPANTTTLAPVAIPPVQVNN